MPILALRTSPPVSADRQAALARGLQALSTRILGKRPAVTAVLVEGLPQGQWFIGGEPPAATALLEIRITAGSNSAEEKQAFIAAAWQELQQQLGPLAEASYVVVQEVDARDWGYAGRTQAQRRSMAAA